MAASPQLLIIDSVLMSALLGRRAPGTAVILTVPPIVKPPPPPCWWHRWSKESQVPIVTERWGDVVGWETFSDRLLSREISGGGQQASSALLGITTTANSNQLDLEQGSWWSRRNIIRARETQMFTSCRT